MPGYGGILTAGPLFEKDSLRGNPSDWRIRCQKSFRFLIR